MTARAGIREPRAKGSATLTGEPILVFLGPRRPTLHIFDQFGRGGYQIADRIRAMRLRGPVRCQPNARPQGLEYEFVVSDPGGAIIGTINRSKVRIRDAFSREDRMPNLDHRISCDGETVATINERPRREVLAKRAAPSNLITRAHYLMDYLCCCRYTIEDKPGHAVARITYVQPFFVRDQMSFVLESEPRTPEPLRTMLVPLFIVVDEIRPRHHGN